LFKTQIQKNFDANKKVAKSGGKIAGDARKQLEIKSGKKIISSQNYLPEKKTKILDPRKKK